MTFRGLYVKRNTHSFAGRQVCLPEGRVLLVPVFPEAALRSPIAPGGFP